MILYVNGCSHSVGHAIKSHWGMCCDESKYCEMGEAPHPENYPYTYGRILADKHNLPIINQGKSGGSNDRIIRTTKQFLAQLSGDVVVVIGWTGFDREEWYHEGAYFQINSSGTDSVPAALRTRYKEWVANMNVGRDTHDYWVKPTRVSFFKILNFHHYLKNKNIKHLFFNTAGDFESIPLSERVDFGDNYISPYTANSCYLDQMRENKFKTMDNWFHYGEDAHQFWAEYLDPHLTKILQSK